VSRAGGGRSGADRGSNLILIGYRGCGKSSVGRLVAQRLGRLFTDTDERVERLAGRCVRDIFRIDGEAAFRRMESQVLQEVLSAERQVVSVGGGAVLVAANRQRMRQAGLCIWLQASAEELERRLAADPRSAELRPALTDDSPRDEIERLLAIRAPLYADTADARVKTDGRSIAQVTDALVAILRARGWPPLSPGGSPGRDAE
jgi:shikimate kinase